MSVFPDLETALSNWALAVVTMPTGVVLSTGSVLDLPEGQCALRFTVVTDPDDGITRRALVDVEAFAPTRALGYNLGKQVHHRLTTARRVDGILVDRVLTVSGPSRRPWDNPNVRRFLSQYRISTRQEEGAPQW